MLGWVFDWKGWIIGTAAGSGGSITFLKAAIEGRSPLDVWVLAVVVAAGLAIVAYVTISILEKYRKAKRHEPGSQPSQSVGEFDSDFPDVRVADDQVAWGLFGAPHHDKLLPLLERGKIDAWGRLGSGGPPLTLIPANQ
jgi:hypothetical protein